MDHELKAEAVVFTTLLSNSLALHIGDGGTGWCAPARLVSCLAILVRACGKHKGLSKSFYNIFSRAPEWCSRAYCFFPLGIIPCQHLYHSTCDAAFPFDAIRSCAEFLSPARSRAPRIANLLLLLQPPLPQRCSALDKRMMSQWFALLCASQSACSWVREVKSLL
jgi:hypothetical protein